MNPVPVVFLSNGSTSNKYLRSRLPRLGRPLRCTPRERLGCNRRIALSTPAVRDKLIEKGLEPHGSTPEEFMLFVQKEIGKWRDVAKRANVRIE